MPNVDSATAMWVLRALADNFNRLYILRDYFQYDPFPYDAVTAAISHAEKCIGIVSRIFEESETAENEKVEEKIQVIDDLGRIAIPKEMRRRLGIEPGEHLKIRIDEAAGAVVITKEGSE